MSWQTCLWVLDQFSLWNIELLRMELCLPWVMVLTDVPMRFLRSSSFCLSVLSYVPFILSLFILLLSFFWCFGRVVLRDCGISWVSLLIRALQTLPAAVDAGERRQRQQPTLACTHIVNTHETHHCILRMSLNWFVPKLPISRIENWRKIVFLKWFISFRESWKKFLINSK